MTMTNRSVVYVDNVGIGSGSGVIYDTTGDIVTNAHVVAGEQSLSVTLATGKSYAARLVGTDTVDDLTIVHINASGLPAARFASSGTFSVAQTVLAIGNPLGLGTGQRVMRRHETSDRPAPRAQSLLSRPLAPRPRSLSRCRSRR